MNEGSGQNLGPMIYGEVGNPFDNLDVVAGLDSLDSAVVAIVQAVREQQVAVLERTLILDDIERDFAREGFGEWLARAVEERGIGPDDLFFILSSGGGVVASDRNESFA